MICPYKCLPCFLLLFFLNLLIFLALLSILFFKTGCFFPPHYMPPPFPTQTTRYPQNLIFSFDIWPTLLTASIPAAFLGRSSEVHQVVRAEYNYRAVPSHERVDRKLLLLLIGHQCFFVRHMQQWVRCGLLFPFTSE